MERPIFSNYDATVRIRNYLKKYAQERPLVDVQQEAANMYLYHPMVQFNRLPCDVIPMLLLDADGELREDCPFDTDEVEAIIYAHSRRPDLEELEGEDDLTIIRMTAKILDDHDLTLNVDGVEVTGQHIRARWASDEDEETLAEWLVTDVFGVLDEALYDYYDEAEAPIDEVMEWWLVDEFTFDRLKAAEEITLESLGMRVWGRCCTGQSIVLDRVIINIAKDLFDVA